MKILHTEQLGALVFSLLMVTSMFVTGIALMGAPVAADTTDEPLEPGADITQSNVPATIEEPGTYHITEDIDLGGQAIAALEIKSSNVTIKGNGHTISNGTSEAIHILASGSDNALENVTITNLEITNTETAISAMNVENSSFTDLELVTNNDAGLVFAGGAGQNNLVDNVRFEENEKGIFLREGTSGMTIRNSDFIANHEVAIKASGSSEHLIQNNYFAGQDGEKVIHLTGRSPGTEIRNNEITGSNGPEYVIQVGGESTGTIVADNQLSDNTLGGISIGPINGEVRNNTISGHGDPAISVEGDNSVVAENTVTGNEYGLYLLGTGITGADNTVKNNHEWDVYAADGATNNVLTDLVIDDAGTTVTVTGDAVDFALKGTDAPTPPAPENYDAIGKYVNVTTTSEAGIVGLQLPYKPAEVSITESNLTVAVFDGTEWKGIVDAGVEESHNFVYVNAHVEGILGAVAGTDDIIDPVADAGADTTELANTTVTFDASASYDPGDGASGITEYAWDFDGDDTDDHTGSDAVTNYTYDEAGTYVATLTVTDGNGNTDTDTRVVTVLGEDTEPPVADAGPDHYGLVPSTFEFDGSDSTDNVGIESYEWDLNGNGTTDKTGAQVSQTYTNPGVYVVTLVVTDTSGNTATDTANVTIIESDEEPPVADAGEDRTVEVATSVTFDGSGSTDNIGIENYTWDFGDGTTETGETVTHTYSTEGEFTVGLTVEDAAGNTDTDTASITVAEHVDEEVLQPGEISTCGVIETPGVYTLTEDLYASEEGVTTCFEVKTGNVVLDGNGYTVHGDVAEAAEGVHVLGTTSALENVTITDLTLTGWEGAIAAKNVRDSRFENNDFVSNVDKGIALSGTDSTNNLVAGNSFVDNEKGIFLERGADHTVIQDNTFTANHEAGVKASGAPDTEVLNNVFTDHDGEKVIHFTGESPRATIQGNRVLDSTGPENAIQIGGESGDSLVADNVVAGGTLGGISAGPHNVDIVNNTVYDNGDIGITVGDGGGEVRDNLVYDNRIGIVLDGSSDLRVTTNVVKNNHEKDLIALDGATGNDVTGLVIDDNETTIDIGPSSIDYTIEGGVEGPTTTPYDYTAEGEDFDVNITTDVGTVDLTAYYNGDLVSGTTEDELTLARYNATSETWTGLPTVLDTDADTMQASITEAGIIAPLSGSLGEATADKLVVEPNEDVNFSVTPVNENFTYAWDVDGDGTTDYTGPNATHAYTEGGIYDAVLTISTTDNGFSDALTVQVGVDTEPPEADAGPDRYVQPTVTFDGTNSTDDMDELDALETGIETFEWEFGDGANATGPVVTHTYADDGTYTATLTVTDYVGHTDNDTVTVTVDSVPPNPDAGNQYRYGKINQEISFDASASTDNVDIDRYEWDFGDGTSGTGVTTSTTYDTSGTYTVTLTVVDLAGNEASTTVQVTIEDPDDDDGSNGGADDGNDDTDDSSSGSSGGSPSAGGGGSSGSSGGSDDGTTSGPNVEVNYGNGTQAQVSVGNQGMNDTVRVQFQFQNDDTCVALEQLQFRARQTEEFQFRVNQSTDAPQGAVWQSRTGSQAFGYLSVDHDGEIDDGKFTFRVRTDCLQNANVNAEHLRLYRHNGTEWEQLQTRVLNQTQEQVRFEADAPNFSTFAVGVAESDISVVEARLAEDRIQPGEDASVEVTLTNEGDLESNYEIELESNGATLQTKMVTVPAGETVSATLVETFDTAGEYDLTVDGVTAGTLVVESIEEPTIGTTESAPAPDEGDGGLSLRVLSLALLGLLAMLLGAYVLSRRRITK